MWRAHAGPHEQHYILVTGVAVGHHLALEGLELVLVVTLDVDQANGHLTMPAPVENFAEASLTDHLPDLQLLKRDVPLLQEDAGLAGFTREVTSRQQGKIHFLKLVTGVLIIALLVLFEGKIEMLFKEAVLKYHIKISTAYILPFRWRITLCLKPPSEERDIYIIVCLVNLIPGLNTWTTLLHLNHI